MTTNHSVDGGKLISSSWTNNPEDCAFHCSEIEKCNGFIYDQQAQIHSCALFSGSSVKPSLSKTKIVGSCPKDDDGLKSTARVSTETTTHEVVIEASSTMAALPLTSAWENSTKSTPPIMITTSNNMQVTEDEKEEITMDASRSNSKTKKVLFIIACSVLAILAGSFLSRRKFKKINASPISRDLIPRMENEPSHYFSTISNPNGILGHV